MGLVLGFSGGMMSMFISKLVASKSTTNLWVFRMIATTNEASSRGG